MIRPTPLRGSGQQLTDEFKAIFDAASDPNLKEKKRIRETRERIKKEKLNDCAIEE
jgi:hypothetical protein